MSITPGISQKIDGRVVQHVNSNFKKRSDSLKHKTFSLILFTLVLFSNAFATEQIGTVTASGAFELAGTQVPASAARSMPLMGPARPPQSVATGGTSDGMKILSGFCQDTRAWPGSSYDGQ